MSSAQGNDASLVDVSFTPSASGPDPFSTWAPPSADQAGGAFSMVGSGVSMPAAAGGGVSGVEVNAMRTELGQVKAALVTSEGRVNEATVRAPSALEPSLSP
jgi:hypothetical protein